MELYVCGHLGPPENEALPNNAVRLRLAENDEVVAQALAPRTDIAQRVQWNLASQRGRLGYLEVSDEIDLPAYAWIAVARLNPPVVPMPAIGLQALERRLVSGAELVGALRLRELTPALRRLVEHRDVMLPVRASGAKSLAVLSDRFGAAALAAIADQPALAAPLEERVFAAICEADDRQALALMEEIMQTTPSAVQMALAQGLASSREGAEALVALIEGGKASAFLLANPSLVQRIKAALDAERAKRIDELVALLPSRDAAVEELIKNRRQLFDTATASPERGQAVFKTRCAACHQIGGEGAVIGPQLDGIGNRGLDRIIEDVLDPNRNIDQAFRMHTYVLDDGRILNGLPRRAEGELQVVADQEGKEVSFALASIDEDQPSPLSLMPESLGASISEQDFCDLMAYLSGQRVAGAAK
jgi:putative heme-binding domain-containing protein